MVTAEYLELVKTEVAELSQRLKRQVLGDLYAVTGIYEGIYDLAKRNAALLTELIGRADRARKDDARRDNEVFRGSNKRLSRLSRSFGPKPGHRCRRERKSASTTFFG